MQHNGKRKLRDGREIVVHRNGGLRKLCGCPRKAQMGCRHSWYVNHQSKGGPHYRLSLDMELGHHVATKTEAQAEAEKIRVAIREGRFRRRADPPAGSTSAAQEILWEPFARTYMERRGTPATVNESGYLNRLAASVLPGARGARFGGKPLAAITTDDCEAVFAILRQEGKAASTLNKYRQFLRRLFRWGVKKGYLTRDPMADADTIHHESERGARRSRRLAPDVVGEEGKVTRDGEERQLLKAADLPLQRRIIGALETGCRNGELANLRWADVDLVRRELRVRAETSKTRRSRVLPISARLAGVLEMGRTALEGVLFDGEGATTEQDRARRIARCYVFGDAVGRAVKTTKKAWQTALLKAHGYEPEWARGGKLSGASREALRRIDLHFHDLRHEAGSRLIEAGWPVHHVQEMFGHADLKQTSTYLNATLSGLKESMRKSDEAGDRCKPVANNPATDLPLPCNEETSHDPNSLIH